MYTHYEAHDISVGYDHLVGKKFFRPEDGQFYEVTAVLPYPFDEVARRKMLDICYQLANGIGKAKSKDLGDYMMTVKGEFDIAAMGATENDDEVIFHCVPIQLAIDEHGLSYEFVT